MKIYCLKLDNYQGEYEIEYYRNKENAYKRFNELWHESEQKEEFDWDDEDDKLQGFSFFDPAYNEYSTYISFKERSLEDLFSD